jgi:hypothetical protein
MMQVDVENIFNNVFQTVIFRELCDVEGLLMNIVPLYQVVLWCSFFSLLLAWAACGGIIIIESFSSMIQGDPFGGLETIT